MAGTEPVVRSDTSSGQIKQTTFDIDSFVDSDWAGCATSRRSAFGMELYFLRTLITSQGTGDGCTFEWGGRTVRNRTWSVSGSLFINLSFQRMSTFQSTAGK